MRLTEQQTDVVSSGQLVIQYNTKCCETVYLVDALGVPRPVNIIFLDFCMQFNVRLFSSAQIWTCVISLVAVLKLTAGTIMYVSSANLIITLPTWTG